MPFSTRRGIAAVALALLVAADAVAQAEEGDERVNEAVEDPFDPFEGMDANGRIPRPERPPGIEHPRRWRYIPEGRIKSGNVFQRFLVSSAIVPFIFRDEDVGFGGGVALTDIDFRQQRRREFLGAFVSYSAQGQQSYTFAWRRWVHSFDLPEGGVLQEERSFWRASAGYRKTRTRRFYGFGPDTDEDDETSYTDERVEFELGVQASYPDPGDDLILRLGLRGDFHDLSDGAVKGVPSTEEEFPRVFASAENDDLGWLEVGAAWDTRDSQRNPYRGWLLSADIDAAIAQSDLDAGAVTTFWGSKIVPLPGLLHRGGDPDEENPPTDTLALGLRLQLSAGELPFFALPSLGGGDHLRGYVAGRWRDRASWFGVVEYRFWVIPRGFRIPFTRTIRVERVGLAGFYEAGSVARGGSELFRAQVHHSYGVGLRILLERAAPFRVDVGFSDEDIIVTAKFGLSF